MSPSEFAGISWGEYSILPWKEKKKILRRMHGIGPVRGFFQDVWWSIKWNLYEKWRKPNLKSMLNEWFEHSADDHLIVNNYPQADLSCNHKPKPMEERK